jgi:hypothetical protein
MKPTIVLAALFVSACGGSSDGPTQPVVPVVPDVAGRRR